MQTHGNDVVSDLDVGDALSNTLYYSSTLVSEHDGERALGIVSRELQNDGRACISGSANHGLHSDAGCYSR